MKERDPLLGKNIGGKYRVMALIGKGGMGSVYEAVHTATEKRVAIKVLAEHLASDTKVVTRFRREALASSKLLHENCVQVLDFGEDPLASFFITMEFVNGHGLDAEVARSGPMPADRVARIGVQIASALDSAHAAGIIHRDLKPANIMITQKAGRPDFVKVVDFGIAKFIHNSLDDQQALTVPGTIFGTPEYMSPEQARGDPLDGRSDLYSAAVVLWHLLLGRSPFRGESIRETLLNVFQEDPISPTTELDKDLSEFEAALMPALAKSKEQRPVDANALLALLEPFVGKAGVALVTKKKLPLKGISDDGSAPETLPAEAGMRASSESSHLPEPAEAADALTLPPSASLPPVDSASEPDPDSSSNKGTPFVEVKQPEARLIDPEEKLQKQTRSAQSARGVDAEGRRWAWFAMSAAAFLVVLLGGAALLRALLEEVGGDGATPPAGIKAGTKSDAGVKSSSSFARLLASPPDGYVANAKACARALRKGERAIDDEKYGDAQRFFEAAILADRASPAAHRGYGLASFHLGQLELSKAHLEYLFELDDDNMAAQAAAFLAIIEKKLERQKARKPH